MLRVTIFGRNAKIKKNSGAYGMGSCNESPGPPEGHAPGEVNASRLLGFAFL